MDTSKYCTAPSVSAGALLLVDTSLLVRPRRQTAESCQFLYRIVIGPIYAEPDFQVGRLAVVNHVAAVKKLGAQLGFDFVIAVDDDESSFVRRQNRPRQPVPSDANLTALIGREKVQSRTAGRQSRDAKSCSQCPDSEHHGNQHPESGITSQVRALKY
jgi:hypothetical protein